MWLAEAPTATVANMQDNNPVGFDGEENPILMWLVAANKLTHFERKLWVFGREHAAFWHLRQRKYRLFQLTKPSQSGVACLLRQKPFEDDV